VRRRRIPAGDLAEPDRAAETETQTEVNLVQLIAIASSEIDRADLFLA